MKLRILRRHINQATQKCYKKNGDPKTHEFNRHCPIAIAAKEKFNTNDISAESDYLIIKGKYYCPSDTLEYNDFLNIFDDHHPDTPRPCKLEFHEETNDDE